MNEATEAPLRNGSSNRKPPTDADYDPKLYYEAWTHPRARIIKANQTPRQSLENLAKQTAPQTQAQVETPAPAQATRESIPLKRAVDFSRVKALLRETTKALKTPVGAKNSLEVKTI